MVGAVTVAKAFTLVCLTLFLQTHPNVDKKLFNADGVVALKNQSKPFPLNQDIGVLKWRFQTQDDSFMPLSSQYRSLRVPSASIRDQ